MSTIRASSSSSAKSRIEMLLFHSDVCRGGGEACARWYWAFEGWAAVRDMEIAVRLVMMLENRILGLYVT